MSSSEALRIEDSGPVRHLILNRPEKLNAIDITQHERLMAAFAEAEHNSDIRVLALSGEGRGFCAGDDLTAEKRIGPNPHAKRAVDLEMGSGPAVLLESCAILRRLTKPTVALIHGVALGSGYDYSLSCDFRLVTEDIRFGDPRIDRALWAAEGWSYKLPRLTNQSVVTPIAYLGRLMNGNQALEYGLAHAILDIESDIREAARPFLVALSLLDTKAYASTTAAILDGLDATFEQSLTMQAAHP